MTVKQVPYGTYTHGSHTNTITLPNWLTQREYFLVRLSDAIPRWWLSEQVLMHRTCWTTAASSDFKRLQATSTDLKQLQAASSDFRRLQVT